MSKKAAQIEQKAKLSLNIYKNLLARNQSLAHKLSFKSTYTLPKKICYLENEDDESQMYLNHEDCDKNYPYRTMDGSCNNLAYTWWGRAGTPYKRLLKSAYQDNIEVPRVMSEYGGLLPNPRQISLTVHEPIASKSEWSHMALFFAQNLAHDVSLIAASSSSSNNNDENKCECGTKDEDCFNIRIPDNDYYNIDRTCMPFLRSAASPRDPHCSLGPREQLNMLTHWLDMSQLYGSSDERTNQLRLFKQGLLKYSQIAESDFEFLPKRRKSCPIESKCYMAGETRAEDNAFLLSMHTIWLREHNRLARGLSDINPHWSDELLFQTARKILIAEYQHIVYNELVPILLSPKVAHIFGLLPLKKGYFYDYDEKLYPQVTNEFATAGFRFGHTFLSRMQHEASSDFYPHTPRPTSHYLFNSSLVRKSMDGLLRGCLVDNAYYPTPQVNPTLNHYLFDGLFDTGKRWSLPALNIQRGRDHGLPSYNHYRELCGLKRALRFKDLDNIRPEFLEKLKEVYKGPDDVDLFGGLFSEYPVEDGMLGFTASCIVGKTFRDLKYGDRFYYENGNNIDTRFTLKQLNQIRKITFSRILCDNTNIDKVQGLAFLLADRKLNPYVNCADIEEMDLSAAWEDPAIKTKKRKYQYAQILNANDDEQNDDDEAYNEEKNL